MKNKAIRIYASQLLEEATYKADTACEKPENDPAGDILAAEANVLYEISCQLDAMSRRSLRGRFNDAVMRLALRLTRFANDRNASDAAQNAR